MKRSILILILLNLWIHETASQKLLTLGECYELAVNKSALSSEKEKYNNIWQLKDQNLQRNWLPTLDASANITYNSDVVNMREMFSSIPIPGLAESTPLMPHDMYKLAIDVNQMIYDGGSVRKARDAEEAEMRLNQQQTEAELYKLRSQVNSYYFSILITGRQEELLKNYLEVIGRRLQAMQSALKNGTILRSDIDVMISEKIRIEQQLTELGLKRKSLVTVLSDLTGTETGSEFTLILPQIKEELSVDLSRPELKIFDIRKDQIEAGIEILQSKRMPKAFGFATLGYGSPQGNDFFNDKFGTYYTVGAGLKWNIYDWKKVNSEKQQMTLQQSMLEGRKSDLSDNIRRSLELKSAEIEAIESALIRDSELIAIRKRITASAESQYENGIITATELLAELTSEKQAEINYEIRKISLVMARVEYLNISGNEIE